jgi:hypothetical protein
MRKENRMSLRRNGALGAGFSCFMSGIIAVKIGFKAGLGKLFMPVECPICPQMKARKA